ncbi:inactive protein RESTRICTED TEV MOVEMENT 1-like [Diospyros lotus]|uniref:inactive protein RESTRICTED TEV MOVEMENT 1-like n=1 Tax=Diospyros lotus TaxID=55363 RepID=UPI002255DC1C|nr:inactive protein RESTRICTED TEV MOVEMENT 1-like [Diospyros lotus]XP_052207938.1 inactive protein RESTRICTED TEV MOVEMENT 1-like [Diospyros lotus]
MIKLPTVSSTSGEAWDHKGRTELVEIFISYDDYAIKFLQFLYAENGSLVLSERPDGSYLGNKFITVMLQYPNEFLTSLKGTYGYDSSGYRILTSIEFGTNLGNHGPFGEANENDEYFDLQMGNHRQFGGFHGTTKFDILRSIGVYVKPIASLSNLNSINKSTS